MAKPRTPNQKKNYAALNKRLSRYVANVQSIYDEIANTVASIALDTAYAPESARPFRFNDYTHVRSRIDRSLSFFVKDIHNLIYAGTSEEWKQSNLIQDLLAKDVLRSYGVKRNGVKEKRYYRSNSDALRAFQSRKDKGLNLSQKLWIQSNDLKAELEYCLSSGIQKGMSAITLSKKLSKYLHDFPLLQKDYKEKYGKVVDCHDCEYRSIRLARSEINMAYREAEQLRWQQMDFIKGYKIKLSGSHPKEDICDQLAGIYPKWFKWAGWHPNDLCYAIPIVMTDDEYYNGTGKMIEDVPDGFKKWVAENEDRIYLSKTKGTEPYWVKDNPELFQSDTIKGGNPKDFIMSYYNHLKLKEDTIAEQNSTPFSSLQIKNHEEVSKVLNIAQGSRMSFRSADNGKSNPNYSWIDYSCGIDSKYNVNCVMSVATHELRMRGWDVTAVPYDKKNTVLVKIRNDYTKLWIDPNTKESPKPMMFNARSKNEFYKNLNKKTSHVGRYHLAYFNEFNGHIICVDRLPNGGLRFYDPQDNSLNITSFIEEIRTNKPVHILRVDNLLFNPKTIGEVSIANN